MDPLIIQFGSGSLPRLPLHHNPGLEIVLLRRGQLSWTTEDVEEAVSPGTVYFTLPDQLHGSIHEFEPGHEWLFVVIAATRCAKHQLQLPAELPLSTQERTTIGRCLSQSRRHAFKASPALGLLLAELIEELKQPHEHLAAAKVRLLSSLLIIELVRSVQAECPSPAPQVRGRAEHRVRALVDELRKHPETRWQLDTLAKRCKLKRSQFAAIFLALTGDSPIRFLNRRRVQLACQYLKETEDSVTTIALNCGFESSQYFARVFKRFTGGLDARTYRTKTRQDRLAAKPQPTL